MELALSYVEGLVDLQMIWSVYEAAAGHGWMDILTMNWSSWFAATVTFPARYKGWHDERSVDQWSEKLNIAGVGLQ